MGISKSAGYWTACVLMLLSQLACVKDFKPAWELSVTAPLIKTTLGLEHLAGDTTFTAEDDHSVVFRYEAVIYELSVDSVIDIPDTLLSKSEKFPFYLPVPPGQVLFNKNYEKSFDLGRAQLSEIRLKSGNVELFVTSTFRRAFQLDYSLPYALKNGAPFQLSAQIPASTTAGEALYHSFFDASDYVFNLKGPNNNTFNMIVSHTKATMDPNGDSLLLTPLDSSVMYSKLHEIVLSYAKGYFGTDVITAGPDTSDFEALSKITAGTFHFDEMHVAFVIENNLGLDIQFMINDLTSYNSRTQQSVSLNAGLIGNPVNITRARQTNNTGLPLINTIKTFNLDDSNIQSFIENMPDKFIYQLSAKINPLGNVSGGNDFIYTDNGLKLKLDVQIPLSVSIENLTFQDTVDFNALIHEETKPINSGTFYLITDNGFPADLETQLYFLDESQQLIDSLTTAIILPSGQINGDGRVVTRTRKINELFFPQGKVDNLYKTRFFVVKATVNTAGNKQMVIYDDYKIDLQLTGDMNIQLN